jgi:hypothetical protein
MEDLIAVPAYGAEYKTKTAVLAAWEAGKDFQFVGTTTYVNKEDFDRANPPFTLKIRFCGLRKFVLITPKKKVVSPLEVEPEGRIHREALAAMRSRGGTWAAYENQALDSHNAGHLQFFRFGPGCTYETPPPRYPADTEHGMGWRYVLIGVVNFETNDIDTLPKPVTEVSVNPQ